ncbi:MAG: DMT family transporter [Chloroflexi bacterium]|nr:DMT family transporter [Chloroflexota bacterium]
MPLGELSVLAGSLGWAASNVVAKTARSARALHVSVMHSWVALAILVAVGLAIGLGDDMLRTPWRAAALLAAGAALGAIGNIAFFTAVARGEVGRTFTTTTSLNVLFSILAGWLALGESPGPFTIFGAVAILAGVYIVNRQQHARAPSRSPAPAAPVPASPIPTSPATPPVRASTPLALSPAASPVPAAGVGRGSSPTIHRSSARRFTPGVLALAATAAGLWSIGLIATKIGLRDSDVFTGAVLRNLVPGVAYLGIAFASPTVRLTGVPRGDLGRLVLSAMLFVGSLLGWTFALQRSDASITAILSATSPVFAYVLAVGFLREKVRAQVLAGIALCLAGVVLIVGLG